MSENLMAFFAPEADSVLKALPKCNLHTHLEGSVRPETLWDLAQAQGVDVGLPQDAITAAMEITGEERHLQDYLDKISITYQVLKDFNALRRTAFEAAEDAARDGIVYFELRGGPDTHVGPGLPLEAVIDAWLQGLRKAEAKYDIVCRLIICALRWNTPEVNLNLAHAALNFKNEGVAGFDLAGGEIAGDMVQYKAAFDVARKGGLGITVHAGEAAGPENVRYAVEALEATRIGHGVRSITDPDVLALLRERNILLEVCPTSNIHTQAIDRIKNHPVRQLYRQDIPISIGDDDPVTSRTRVSKELTLLQQQFGFTYQELQHTQEMGIDAAFLTDTTLQGKLRNRITGG
ncbi:MAG: adenosine deaminase [Chloroflexota bacterium]